MHNIYTMEPHPQPQEEESNIQGIQGNLNTLLETYKGNTYMTQRLHYHLSHLLPSTLEQEYKNHQMRILRTDQLTIEKKQFIQVFLNENKYYYLPNNNCFYYYNGKIYKPTKEDTIHYHLLRSISKDRKLMDWKFKIKINVIKQIRERNLFRSVPESYTIQNVLKLLHPAFFSDKNQAKYFLTILGDNILRKCGQSNKKNEKNGNGNGNGNDLIYFVKPKMRIYLQEIESMTYMFTGFRNIMSNFVTKFHENYNYDKCRLLKMTNTVSLEDWSNTLRIHGLNIICVAAHYSQRFESADQYIENMMNNEALENYTLYVKKNNQVHIIQHFCEYCLQPDVGLTISWKKMHYIWKIFLSHFFLPNVLFSNTLKTILKERYSYDETTDSFHNVTSKYLPNVANFIQFWDKTVTVSADDSELEIDELRLLFRKWTQENHINNTLHTLIPPSYPSLSNGNIAEADLHKILNHFFPTVEVVDNKYIVGVSCNMWDKNADILQAMTTLKKIFHGKYTCDGFTELISFDDAYNFYSNFCSKNKTTIHFVSSKRYFEKFITDTMMAFIEYNIFISPNWYMHMQQKPQEQPI